EKLAMNSRLGTSTRRQFACSRSPSETPVTAERYPGTSGRTQGERNETSPAASAAKIPTPAAGSLATGWPPHRPPFSSGRPPVAGGARAPAGGRHPAPGISPPSPFRRDHGAREPRPQRAPPATAPAPPPGPPRTKPPSP